MSVLTPYIAGVDTGFLEGGENNCVHAKILTVIIKCKARPFINVSTL